MEEEIIPAENSNEENSNNDQLLPTEVIIPEEIEAIIEDLPQDKQKAVKGMFVSLLVKESFKGPLPPPSILKGYEEVVPGSGERIIARMEMQSDHRMKMEDRVTAEDQRQSGRGQNYGFIIAMTVLLLSVGMILLGHDVAGTVLGSIDLVALVSVFVIGKVQQRKD